jgi:hypothetical protein
VKADVSGSSSLKGAKSNGKKHIACRNRNRDPLRRCHIRSATAYACQSARRLPWHMQPYRHLLRHVFLLQGIMRQRTSPAGAVKQKVADKRSLILSGALLHARLWRAGVGGVRDRMETLVESLQLKGRHNNSRFPAGQITPAVGCHCCWIARFRVSAQWATR